MNWGEKTDYVLKTPLITEREQNELRDELKNIKACVIHLPSSYDRMIGQIFNTLIEVLPKGATLHIFISPSILDNRSYTKDHLLLRYEHLSHRPGVKLIGARFFQSKLRHLIDHRFSIAGNALLDGWRNPLKLLGYGIEIGIWHTVYFIHNCIMRNCKSSKNESHKYVLSAVLSYRVGK
jgi:hypothetical protein